MLELNRVETLLTQPKEKRKKGPEREKKVGGGSIGRIIPPSSLLESAWGTKKIHCRSSSVSKNPTKGGPKEHKDDNPIKSGIY